jgi:hypothetical protein
MAKKWPFYLGKLKIPKICILAPDIIEIVNM